MKLTKSLEKEIIAAYVAYFDNYIKGNVEAITFMLDDCYNQIGSAESEVFFNKKDAVKFLYDTIDQIAGKTEIRNRILKAEAVDDLILVTDLFDIYAMMNSDWNFYSKFRASTLMKKKNDVWKFIHQHSSMPDARTEGGENIAIEKISAENMQLREAVKRRTLELEQKNHEMEIETTIERVRAIALSMKKPADMIDVCKTISDQLEILGVKDIRNIQTVIINEQNGVYLNYQYFTPYKNSIVEEIKYNNHPTVLEMVEEMKRSVDGNFTGSFEGEELKKFREWRIEGNQLSDPLLDESDTVHYIFFSIGLGGLGLTAYKPIPQTDVEIFKRFHNVFSLAYRRFIDIEKAEAQAREAQIEVALERVRARSMAMHKSGELADLSYELVKQVQALGVATWFCAFNIYDEDQNGSLEWGSNAEGTYPNYRTPREGIFLRYYEAGQKGETLLINEIVENECAAHYNYLCSLPGVGEQLLKMKDAGIPFPISQIDHVAYFKYGYIIFITYEPAPEAHDIFKRFAKVFEQTYTRFLDLEKAEAQAREAQIEAGLERARAQSMMMQQSDELNKTTQVFHEQLSLLGIDSEFSYLWLPDEEKMEHLFWATWLEEQEGLSVYKNDKVIYPLDKLESSIAECYIAWESDQPVHVNQVKSDRVEAYFDEWADLLKNVHKFKPKYYPNGLYYIDAYMKYGCFGIITKILLLESEQRVLQRFSMEFERAYTRFLDLKNSEAQVREAQIEAALERVRSKAMAMHSSEDLTLTVDTFFSELNKLGVKPHRCGVGIVDRESRIVDVRATTATQENKVKKIVGKLHLAGHTVLEKIFETWENQEEYHPVLQGAEISDYYKIMNPQVEFPDFAEDEIQYGYYFHFKEGGVFAWTDNKFTENELQIFRRYTSVLSLTYRRYIDLKEAEAQARESQIETALERVRSKTMAMQKSSELAHTTAQLFIQLNGLGIKPYRCNIAIINTESKSCQIWSTTNSGNVIPTVSDLPLYEYPVLQDMYKGWETKKPNHVIKLIGEDRLSWSKYISKHLPFEEYKPQKLNEEIILKEAAYFSNFYFRQGFFTIHTKEEFAEDQLKIIQRFAYVFEQTYTRYLDLEKAEKQNKIIQAENERKSNELEEARQLQLAMLPKNLPQLPNLDIAVYMQTATEVGGDYYDFHVGVDGVLTAVIGDATGHGMKAGTIVTITKSMFNSLASEQSILKVFSTISQVIRDMKFRQLSMCLLMLKIINNKLSISSAAMPPAIIYRKNDNKAHEILLNGMPLGALPRFPYKIEETVLNSGDTILLMSDGFPELMNSKGEMFGYEKAIKLFEQIAVKTSAQIINELKNACSNWVEDKTPDDDVTFVVIKIK